jgi:uncharacterized protein (TIRG00374 family)
MLRRILLVGGVLLLVYLLWRLGPGEIISLLGQIGWYAPLIMALYAAHHAVRALALHWCVLRRGILRYSDALSIRLSGEAVHSLTWTGPFLAEPTRAWLLKRRGLTLQEGFAATITEYLINAFVITAMSIAGLALLLWRFEPSGAVSGVAIAMIVIFAAFLLSAAIAISRRFYLIGTIISGLARLGILRGRLRPDMTWINRMEDMLLAVLGDRPRLIAVALLEILAQVFLLMELYSLLDALEMGATALYAFVIESSMKIIGVAFPFVPLHVGVAEGGYAVVFDTVGLPAAAGFAVAFVRRLRSLVVASVGLALLAYLTREEPARLR